MSNSMRAKERRQKRSKLSTHQRARLASQHFGDEIAGAVGGFLGGWLSKKIVGR